MRARHLLFALMAMLAAVSTVLAGPGLAGAGGFTPTTGGIQISVLVIGDDRTGVASTVVPRLELDGVGDLTDPFCGAPAVEIGDRSDAVRSSCDSLAFGTYRSSSSTVPDGFVLDSQFCRTIGFDGSLGAPQPAALLSAENERWECFTVLVQHTRVFVDVVVDGDSAQSSDFETEVFAGGTRIAAGTDPSSARCDASNRSAGSCSVYRLAAGDYRLGLGGPPDHEVVEAACRFELGAFLVIDGPGAAFAHSTDGDVFCTITARFVDPPTTTEPPATTAPPTTAPPATAPPAESPTTVPPATSPAPPPTTAPPAGAPAAPPTTLPAAPVGELPATGSETGLSIIAALLVTAGLGSLAVARRTETLSR